MNTPVEEAASTAVSHVNKVGVALSWAGNGAGGVISYLTAHESELQVVALLLTIAYTVWQFGRDFARDQRDRSTQSKLVAWARRQGMRTEQGPLDEAGGQDSRGNQ